MANELAKYLNSRRRLKDDNAIARQLKIARQHGLTGRDKAVKEPHRLAKHKAMDCGNPRCYMCGNRRRHDGPTTQERRMFQDADTKRDTHSNGLDHGLDQNS